MPDLPKIISDPEWDELKRFEPVREGWGLTNETTEELKEFIYGVKFDFMSGSPGYKGDIYILKGDNLLAPPLMIGRTDGQLTLFEYEA